MTNKPDIRERLLKLQVELQKRLNKTQSEERHEVEKRNDTNAQLWEASEIRDDLNDETVTELRDVNRALSRLDAGNYGICTNCEEPIDPRRLAALPYAELCVSCADQYT